MYRGTVIVRLTGRSLGQTSPLFVSGYPDEYAQMYTAEKEGGSIALGERTFPPFIHRHKAIYTGCPCFARYAARHAGLGLGSLYDRRLVATIAHDILKH